MVGNIISDKQVTQNKITLIEKEKKNILKQLNDIGKVLMSMNDGRHLCFLFLFI